MQNLKSLNNIREAKERLSPSSDIFRKLIETQSADITEYYRQLNNNFALTKIFENCKSFQDSVNIIKNCTAPTQIEE